MTDVDHTLVKTGRREPHPASLSKRVAFASVFGDNLPDPAATRDWNGGDTTRPMWGNDVNGDCTCVTIANLVTSALKVVYGKAPTILTSDVLELYTRFGFDPTKTAPGVDNPTDQGAVFEDVIASVLKLGFKDHHFLGSVAVSPNNPKNIKRSIDWLGGAGVGLRLPLAWQGKKVWSLDGYDRNSSLWSPNGWGGHQTSSSKYDENGVWVWTWGGLVLIPWDALAAYSDEIDGMLTAAWIKEGDTPVKIPLETIYTQMAGLKAAA